MEPGELLPPNKQKIDQLFANLKTGETEDILSACESFIVEDEFFQWEGTPQIRRKREANKQYFLEKGGIQIMLDLVKTTADDLVKRFSVDVLWAYSETDENRRELLFAGVLPIVCECLKVDNAKVQEGAVGAFMAITTIRTYTNKEYRGRTFGTVIKFIDCFKSYQNSNKSRRLHSLNILE